jgi:subtilisin family serine protease
MEPGIWELELRAHGGVPGAPFDVHAWIETDDHSPSSFDDTQKSDDSYTIGTLACGHSTIVVGAYDPFPPHGVISVSGEGPTRDGRLKPEVAAPGTKMKAAQALTNTFSDASGTSVAAPHVAGLIALVTQAAGRRLTIDEIRDLVINPIITSQERHVPPPVANAWDPRYGAGRADARASVLAALPPPPATVAVVAHQESLTATVITSAAPDGDTLQPMLAEAVITTTTVKVEALAVPATPAAAGPPAPGEAEPPAANDGEVSPPPPVTAGH